jgi:TPR repeat protein
MGVIYHHLNQQDQAIEILTRLSQRGDPMASYLLGNIYYSNRKDPEKAYRAFVRGDYISPQPRGETSPFRPSWLRGGFAPHMDLAYNRLIMSRTYEPEFYISETAVDHAIWIMIDADPETRAKFVRHLQQKESQSLNQRLIQRYLEMARQEQQHLRSIEILESQITLTEQRKQHIEDQILL